MGVKTSETKKTNLQILLSISSCFLDVNHDKCRRNLKNLFRNGGINARDGQEMTLGRASGGVALPP